MSYSHEEVERKRLLALQRKQQAQAKNNVPSTVRTQNNIPSTSSINNENKLFNTSKPFGNRWNKSVAFNTKFKDNSFKGNTKYNKQQERFSPIGTKSFFGQTTRVTAKCHIISDDRFTLEMSSYMPVLIEACKTVPSRSYDAKTKTWNFNLKDYENLMGTLIKFKSDIQVVGLSRTVLQAFRNNGSPDNNVKNVDLSKIDAHLLSQLMPFQREGICYGISKNGRCLIADDMGLGKTIQALGIAHYFRTDWPLLIVVPSSVRYQWADAIYTFLPSVPAHYIYHFSNTKDFIDNNKIVITSYDLLVRAIDTFECKSFGFVILDESHVLKSIKTARYKAAQCVASKAGHIILLSGTPALSRPIELYSQINLVMPNFMGYQEYGTRYCAGVKTAFGWDFSGSSNMQELQLLLKRTCVIRRLKTEVLNELPSKKRYIRIDGKTNPEHRKYQVDKFQSRDDYLAAVLSITSANAGITLTAAQLVVFAELFWNPGVLCQAEDRVHRIGQDDNVLIQYLVAKQTADDYLWPLIQKKMNVLNEVGLDQDFSLKDVSVTKHNLDSKQRTLDYFTSATPESATGEETAFKTGNNESTTRLIQDNNAIADEMKELLELGEADLNFCDWDDME
ncbi:SWI/SNF-related matrix-associated actin-dependent regulator of chromatin subfamily A-like protein 1 isoform X2 [Megalopta genalis]|uniref:SWI/SNF-related matrix-associated actin-dependent regulator of chromatin subfamily A-like protein 1 isoform X2 n=1 Tax=Megalopta genalis TaxID=115081 RepID=UPI003FD5B450